MGHKVLTHCFRSLIWLALLHFQTKASPCPGTEPDACKVHQFNLGVSAWNTAMQSLSATNGAAAAAPETPPLDQGERGSSVAEMACSPRENDRTCGEGESAHKFKPPSTPCENLLVDQVGGNSYGALQSGGSSRIALEKVTSCGSNGYPNSAMAVDQVQAPEHQLPLQHGSETEQQDACLPALEQAMMDESAWNSDSSLILLPTETADQSMQGHECRPSTTTGDDSTTFGDELRKETNRPESGQPSRQHNAIPLTEILRSTAEGTMTDDDDSLKERGLGIDNKDISARLGELQAPAATSDGSVLDFAARNGTDGGGALLSILAKKSGKPGSGDPSKGHN